MTIAGKAQLKSKLVGSSYWSKLLHSHTLGRWLPVICGRNQTSTWHGLLSICTVLTDY